MTFSNTIHSLLQVKELVKQTDVYFWHVFFLLLCSSAPDQDDSAEFEERLSADWSMEDDLVMEY